MTHDFHGLYINLDRAENRRRRLEAEFARFGLSARYRRVRAVSDSEPWRGCWKSHLKALAEAQRLGGIVHIAEDDVILSDRLAPFLASPQLQELLARFDIVYLSMWVDPDPGALTVYTRAVEAAGTGHAFVDMRVARAGSTDSYVVAPRSIEKLLGVLAGRLAQPPPTTLDGFINRTIKAGGLTAAAIVPFLSCIDLVTGVQSSIQREMSGDEQSRLVKLRTSFFVDRNRQPHFTLQRGGA